MIRTNNDSFQIQSSQCMMHSWGFLMTFASYRSALSNLWILYILFLGMFSTFVRRHQSNIAQSSRNRGSSPSLRKRLSVIISGWSETSSHRSFSITGLLLFPKTVIYHTEMSSCDNPPLQFLSHLNRRIGHFILWLLCQSEKRDVLSSFHQS